MAIKGAIIGDIIGSQFEFHNIYADKKIAPQDIVVYANKDTICCGYNDNKTAILLTDKEYLEVENFPRFLQMPY